MTRPVCVVGATGATGTRVALVAAGAGLPVVLAGRNRANYHERLDDAGERWLDLFACRYLDRFERRAGTWAIVRRVVVHDWDAVLPLAGDFGDMVKTFTAGRRDRDDESYRGER